MLSVSALPLYRRRDNFFATTSHISCLFWDLLILSSLQWQVTWTNYSRERRSCCKRRRGTKDAHQKNFSCVAERRKLLQSPSEVREQFQQIITRYATINRSLQQKRPHAFYVQMGLRWISFNVFFSNGCNSSSLSTFTSLSVDIFTIFFW